MYSLGMAIWISSSRRAATACHVDDFCIIEVVSIVLAFGLAVPEFELSFFVRGSGRF
jgi:hypothetical protein